MFWLTLAAAVALLPASPTQAKKKLSFERTETRERCADFNRQRNPYFGELHTHTVLSFDAIVNGTRNEPRDSYRFALGETVGLPPFDAQGVPARTLALRRPLDFAAITDHAEFFGEVDVCRTPGLPGYDDPLCELLRDDIGLESIGAATVFWGLTNAIPGPEHFPFCGPPGSVCPQASLVWQDTQAAAEEFYDRSESCAFTTFVAYEWTGTPSQANLHRNVIFRNDAVPPLPISYIEEQKPQDLWAALQSQCTGAVERCDWLAIPHNSNLSVGLMFDPVNADGSPLTAADARTRAVSEPLVEVIQHKGGSECRPGSGTTDELCAFEKLTRLTLVGSPSNIHPPLNFVRNVLKEGLVQEGLLGENPFKLGMIGSTDTHNGTPGATNEEDYAGAGHIGTQDGAPATQLDPTPLGVGGIEANAGGLAVIWAQENSRDALFEAMERREVYATSGTRPIVRFFGSWKFKDSLCEKKNFVKKADKDGVPMGGDLPARPMKKAPNPRFLVSALKDPGAPGSPGTQLERIQIVKGWVDQGGQAQEQVVEVVGDTTGTAGVDLATCTPTGPGYDSLCSVWEDVSFDPAQRAFYYARVLEKPTCRWNTRLCNDLQVDCAGVVPPEYAECCNPGRTRTIRERAWTSPIWYQPPPGS